MAFTVIHSAVAETGAGKRSTLFLFIIFNSHTSRIRHIITQQVLDSIFIISISTSKIVNFLSFVAFIFPHHYVNYPTPSIAYYRM
jgi:hypothetical protein